MFRPQVVFIHIPKTAGTSQRALFYHNYGQENVFWFGVQGRPSRWVPSRIVLSRLMDFDAVGGHRSFRFFRHIDQRVLFASVVREPVARVASLYNYFRSRIAEPNRTGWLWSGLDPHSIVRTIFECQRFRREISNSQCKYLSGGNTFAQVQSVLESRNFVVGSFDDLGSFGVRHTAALPAAPPSASKPAAWSSATRW